MAKYLATYNDTLGDIEISGFIIMTDKEIERFEELATSITWGFDYKMGEGSEEIPFSSGEDLISRIDYKEISLDEGKVLKKLFNSKFGTFVGIEYLEEVIGEENDPASEIDEEDDSTYED